MDERLPLPSVFGLLLDTNDQDQWPPEATLIAAYDGNVRRLKEIARGLDVNGRGVDSVLRRTTFKGMDALHAAAGGKGKLPICRYLVEEAKMDVNKRDTFKGKSMTPLQHAVFSGNLPIVRFLLDRGADLHQEGSLEGYEGLTALHTAAQKGWCEIAKLLLSRGAYVDGKSCHMTPLQLAVHGGHDSTLKVLLDHNADPNKEVNLSTPLTIALRTPSLSCLKLLIQARAEVNGIGNPLARAAQEGLTEAIKCLLEAGANPNTTDWCGKFPVELAAVYGTREDVEILFPCTSPIPTLTNWSIDGIINHMEPERKQREDDDFVEARKSDLKRHGGDAFKKQDYINSSAFYTQAVKVCNTFGRTNKIWGGTHTRKHSSTVRAQMAFVLVVLSFAYLPLLPLAMATATITMKMELCNPHALATHILHSCPGVSNPSATQCCDRLVLAVDEEGGGRCLCRAVAEMAKVGEARTYNQLARLYLDCGGLNAEAVHRHKCSGNATGWTGTAVAPKQSPPAVKAAMKGQPGHGSSAPIPRLFMNGWKAMLEAFLAALSPALLFLAYQFGLLCAKWITWVYKWLSDWISPMAGSPGSTVQLQQIVTERPAIAQKDSHVCPSDTNMLSRRSLPSPHAGDDQKAVEDDLRRKAQRLKEYELGPISADTDEIFEEYGTPCSVLAQAAELDRLLPTVQNQKYE